MTALLAMAALVVAPFVLGHASLAWGLTSGDGSRLWGVIVWDHNFVGLVVTA